MLLVWRHRVRRPRGNPTSRPGFCGGAQRRRSAKPRPLLDDDAGEHWPGTAAPRSWTRSPTHERATGARCHLKEFRWGKGRSGNPGGRPRGRSIKAILTKALAQRHNGKTIYEVIGDVLVREALKGKHQAIRELLDRVEGPIGNAAAGGPAVQQLVVNICDAEPPPGWRDPDAPSPAPPQRLLTGDGRENVRVVEPG
jgi:hypothetical protein